MAVIVVSITCTISIPIVSCKLVSVCKPQSADPIGEIPRKLPVELKHFVLYQVSLSLTRGLMEVPLVLESVFPDVAAEPVRDSVDVVACVDISVRQVVVAAPVLHKVLEVPSVVAVGLGRQLSLAGRFASLPLADVHLAVLRAPLASAVSPPVAPVPLVAFSVDPLVLPLAVLLALQELAVVDSVLLELGAEHQLALLPDALEDVLLGDHDALALALLLVGVELAEVEELLAGLDGVLSDVGGALLQRKDVDVLGQRLVVVDFLLDFVHLRELQSIRLSLEASDSMVITQGFRLIKIFNMLKNLTHFS